MKRRELLLLLSGAMTAAPGVRAQKRAMPVVSYLGGGAAGPSAPFVAALRQGLSETGYVEGQNLAMEYRFAEGHYDRLPALAVDLVSRNVDVIVAGGTPPILAAKSATSTIAIIFVGGVDPVERGLVASLAHPGGNLTGVTFMTRYELLSELLPQTKVIALLVNPNNEGAERIVREVQEAARTNEVQLHILKAGSESDIDAAFPMLAQLQVSGLVVSIDPFFSSRREQLVALAARHAVPTIYFAREFAAVGGLISYGSNLASAFRLAGIYAGRVIAVTGREQFRPERAGTPIGPRHPCFASPRDRRDAGR